MATNDPGMMPLAPPPFGVTPNFDHPASRKSMLIAVMSVIAALATLIFALRVYARAFIHRTFDASDWTAVVGFVIWVGYSYILFELAVIPGVGNHDYELRVKDIPQQYYSTLIATGILQAICSLFIKLSIFLLIGRLFWIRVWARYLVYLGIIMTAIVYAVNFILSLYFCVPRPGETAMGILIGMGTHRCLHLVTLSSVTSAYNAVSDIYILAIALTIVMRLQTSLNRRIRTSVVFSIGVVATGLSITNAYFRIANNATDTNWEDTILFIVGYYEICLGMICACLPCLPILGKSAMAQRILNSRIFSSLSSIRTRSKTSIQREEPSLPESDNSSTTRLAQKEDLGHGTITRSFEVDNSYELQTHGFGRPASQETH